MRWASRSARWLPGWQRPRRGCGGCSARPWVLVPSPALIPVSSHVSREEGSFDDWLEAGLRRELAPLALRPAPAPQYRIRSGRGRRRGLSIFTGTSAALGLKAVTGFAVTA